jgi:TATA-binding protein-associated factor Taf7
VLTVDGVQHEVWLQDLPAVVESYKTLDDANLVKITDIGQVRLSSSWDKA